VALSEKAAQASPVVCVQDSAKERDRLRQKALVDSIESNV